MRKKKVFYKIGIFKDCKEILNIRTSLYQEKSLTLELFLEWLIARIEEKITLPSDYYFAWDRD